MTKKIICCIAAVLALIVLSAREGFACSCPRWPGPLPKLVRDEKSKSAAVFTGKVLTVVENVESESVSVELKVIDVWKGAIPERVTILTGLHDGNCRYHFKVGETYLVYAFNSTMYSDTKSLSTHICWRTAELSEAIADIPYLGRRRKHFKN